MRFKLIIALVDDSETDTVLEAGREAALRRRGAFKPVDS